MHRLEISCDEKRRKRRYYVIDKMKRSSRGDDGSFFSDTVVPRLTADPCSDVSSGFLFRCFCVLFGRTPACFALASCTDLENFRENGPVKFFGQYLHLKCWAELMNITVSQLITFFVGLSWSPFDVSLQSVPLHENRHFHEISTGWVTGCHQLVQYRPVTPSVGPGGQDLDFGVVFRPWKKHLSVKSTANGSSVEITRVGLSLLAYTQGHCSFVISSENHGDRAGSGTALSSTTGHQPPTPVLVSLACASTLGAVSADLSSDAQGLWRHSSTCVARYRSMKATYAVTRLTE